jgi:hypothetical protein
VDALGRGRTYLLDRGVHVTDRYLTVDELRWPIAELVEVWTARPVDRLADWATLNALFTAPLALGAMAWIPPAASIGYAAVAVAVAVAAHRARPKHYEMWGAYRGYRVLLFSTTDQFFYGRVSRAVVRARERG